MKIVYSIVATLFMVAYSASATELLRVKEFPKSSDVFLGINFNSDINLSNFVKDEYAQKCFSSFKDLGVEAILIGMNSAKVMEENPEAQFYAYLKVANRESFKTALFKLDHLGTDKSTKITVNEVTLNNEPAVAVNTVDETFILKDLGQNLYSFFNIKNQVSAFEVKTTLKKLNDSFSQSALWLSVDPQKMNSKGGEGDLDFQKLNISIKYLNKSLVGDIDIELSNPIPLDANSLKEMLKVAIKTSFEGEDSEASFEFDDKNLRTSVEGKAIKIGFTISEEEMEKFSTLLTCFD